MLTCRFLPTWQNYSEVLWKSDGVRPFIMHKYGGMCELELSMVLWATVIGGSLLPLLLLL